METTIKTLREHKGKSIISFPDEFCFIDLETTGLSPEDDEIIEVAAILVKDGIVVDTFESLIKPPLYNGVYVDEFITDLTGITNEMLERAPEISEVLPLYLDFIGARTVIGYNVHFDANFIYDNALSRFNRLFSNDLVDVMRITRKLFPDLLHHRLSDMIAYFDLPDAQEHRAMGDCYATMACYERCKREIAMRFVCSDEFIKSFERTHRSWVRAAYDR